MMMMMLLLLFLLLLPHVVVSPCPLLNRCWWWLVLWLCHDNDDVVDDEEVLRIRCCLVLFIPCAGSVDSFVRTVGGARLKSWVAGFPERHFQCFPGMTLNFHYHAACRGLLKGPHVYCRFLSKNKNYI